MNHMMIDLETLSTRASAVVVSVGVCVFDEERILYTRYWVLDIKEQMAKGRHVSADTIKWWMGQSKEARDVFSEKNVFSLERFATEFISAFKNEKLYLWGNGADFDLSIMINLFDECNLQKPEGWKYSNHMCYRTFATLHKCKSLIPRIGTHHNAMDDAVHQAKCVLASGALVL